MASDKEELINLGRSEDNLEVQKSRPLLSLWNSGITLPEFKILDLYLGRINSHDDEHRVVIIEKGEVEKALGVTQIKKADLKKRLKHLMGNVVEIPDTEGVEEFELVTLFEDAVAKKDKNGQWQVKLECTEKAKKYFFNIDNLGYYRYKLRCIKNITSRQTYVMFNYLEANRFRKKWTVEVDELKKILNCDNKETYNEYKRFNDLVLKKVYKDIHENTECRYSYTPIRKGRRVYEIEFEVETLKDVIINREESTAQIADTGSNDLWKQAIEQFNFTKEQYDEIFSLIVTIPDYKLPESTASYGNIELMRYHYLDQKCKEIIRRDQTKKIRSKFGYLIKLIKQDLDNSETSSSSNTNSFHNFPQHNYDFDALEKELLNKK